MRKPPRSRPFERGSGGGGEGAISTSPTHPLTHSPPHPSKITASLLINRPCSSAGVLPGDSEVVELDDRVRLRPEPDAPCILERVVGRIEDHRSVEPDDEVISGRLDLQRVPGVLGYLDRLVMKGTPPAD